MLGGRAEVLGQGAHRPAGIDGMSPYSPETELCYKNDGQIYFTNNIKFKQDAKILCERCFMESLPREWIMHQMILNSVY